MATTEAYVLNGTECQRLFSSGTAPGDGECQDRLVEPDG